MRKLLVTLLATVAIATVGYSQTTTDTNTTTVSATSLWDFATTGSNYWVTVFPTYSLDSHDFGYGIAVGYHIPNTVVSPMLRFDRLAGVSYLVSGNLQLEVPRSLMGKVPIHPFGLAGAATAIGGSGLNNGTLAGMTGVGAYVKWSEVFGKTTGITTHMNSAADIEYWFGVPTALSKQIRIAPLVINF